MTKKDLPIGVFDSGIGGLTVAKAIIDELPHESIIYLGDTARVPYGTRSREVITKFALELVNFLLKKKIKILVVACNTISANSLEAIRKISPVPVIDVIGPTLKEAKKYRRVGVIGSQSTIASGVYGQVARFTQSCPLFIPLAEEGMTKGKAVEEIARGYLSGLKQAKINTLILGCTHFPLLYSAIAKTIGGKVEIITSGPPTARALKNILVKKHLLRSKNQPKYIFNFTDAPQRVIKIAESFFGKRLPGKIKKISL